MTTVYKLNVRSVYAWSIGPNGFEGVFIICPNDESIIELTDKMKRHQKYDEFVFITKERKISTARDLYIVEDSNYHKLNTITNNNENIYTIQDLDLDVKNFHNKFNSSILSTLPIYQCL